MRSGRCICSDKLLTCPLLSTTDARWFTLTIFAQTTSTTSWFKLKDKCRSEKWEVYLYGDMTIKVMGSRRAENCGVLRSCSSWRDGKAFLGPCTQVHGQGFPPPSGRGRGGGDAGSLLPGVLPPN